jgi:hypothetical protein
MTRTLGQILLSLFKSRKAQLGVARQKGPSPAREVAPELFEDSSEEHASETGYHAFVTKGDDWGLNGNGGTQW